MAQPKYYKSRLVVTGSDSVDELVRRCEGNFERAESLLHAMLDNYLAFDDLRRGREEKLLAEASVELSQCMNIFEDTLHRWLNGEVNVELAETHFAMVKALGAKIERLQGSMRTLPPIPDKMRGCI